MHKFLFNQNKIRELINCPLSKEELLDYLKKLNIHGVDYENEELEAYDYFLALGIWYANEKYPEAKLIDKLSFATLLSYFATGLYGGFGTEEYKKEQLIDKHIIEKIGGKFSIKTGFGFIPKDVLDNGLSEKDTEECFYELEKQYFEEYSVKR